MYEVLGTLGTVCMREEVKVTCAVFSPKEYWPNMPSVLMGKWARQGFIQGVGKGKYPFIDLSTLVSLQGINTDEHNNTCMYHNQKSKCRELYHVCN